MKYIILFLLFMSMVSAQQKTATLDININVIDDDSSTTIYESSSQKSLKLVPFFILGTIGLICLALIWKLT
ncbi:hypothetical protein HQ529_02795 [Candidatus Woesearchaeota archaeon]|nr:hypothetical protein [Candidatus Woesearchaeota archaeon]